MTRAELVKKMHDTADMMASTADALDFYGASAEAAHHAEELANAADIVGEWADELEKEEEK